MKKTKETKKKLSIKKMTIADLAGMDLENIKGGADPYIFSAIIGASIAAAVAGNPTACANM